MEVSITNCSKLVRFSPNNDDSTQWHMFSFFNCKIGQLRFRDKNTNHLRKAIVYGKSSPKPMDPWAYGGWGDTSFAAPCLRYPTLQHLTTIVGFQPESNLLVVKNVYVPKKVNQKISDSSVMHAEGEGKTQIATDQGAASQWPMVLHQVTP